MVVKCPKCNTDNPSDSKYCKECAAPLPSREVSVTETLETPTEELTTGTIFAGRYKIIEELGKGGMGKVYKAIDKKLNEEVALKLIKPEIASDKKTLERFNNELKFARKIAHKNVGRMYELMEEKGTHFITMEYVPGQDLRGLIRQTGQLAMGTAVSIAKQVCEGLTEAHRLGVIHRDLKPQNVMIDKEGNARIMDFGIARSVSGKGITGAGVIVGTPEYMSPEQVESKESDQRSDVYSLGIILYEMVTGRVPFEGDTPFTIGVKHKSEAPQNPKEINSQIPDDLSNLILRCMEKDKEKRYQSAGEVCSELENIERGIPTTERIEPQRKPTTSKEITVTLRKPWLMVAALVVVAIVIGTAIIFFRGEKPILSPSQKRLVVLPFKNLGHPEDEYFADSITEEIRARLTQIGKLGMIARTSAYKYKNTDKSIRNIGEELEVDYVLDGTISWQKFPDGSSRVRIIPELIKASDSTNIWTEVYDEDMTDIFEVQSAIAEQVSEALNITLGEDKRKALQNRPTTNMDAYNSYLKGIDYFNRSTDEEDIRIAIQMFERAIQLDPNFALAYAHLTRSYISLYWIYYFRVDMSLLAKAKEAADKAYELSPDSPWTHWALGFYYYHGHMDYERALEHFYKAQKGAKENSDILEGISYVLRRQGKFDQAVVNLKKAVDFDPLSYRKADEIAGSYFFMRKYTEAEQYWNRAISLSPNYADLHSAKMLLYLAWEGNVEKANRVIEEAPRSVQLSREGYFVLTSVLVHIITGDYQKAMSFLSGISLDVVIRHTRFVPKDLLYAQIYGLMGQSKLEKEHYDSARRFLEAKVKEWPEDARVHSSLGIVYAGLGRNEEAVREGKKAVELIPVDIDAWRGPYFIEGLTRIYIKVGEYNAAIDQLEYLLSIPSQISIPLLRIDPTWNPLRDNPRFQKILKRGK